MERTLSQVYGYKPLQNFNGLPGRHPISTKKTRFGLEIEVEDADSTGTPKSFAWTSDGSLKVNGVELVSQPIELQYFENELIRLKNNLLLKEHSFSSRCSVHIHMNVRDMTNKEILLLLLIYLVYEKSLFKFSGDREDNNFCIPLQHLHKLVREQVLFLFNNYSEVLHKWNKYTAFNLVPIYGDNQEGSKALGTIEFRHMKGNLDIPYILDWCSLLGCMKRVAKHIDLDTFLSHVRTINTTSGYGWFTRYIFGKWDKHIINQLGFEQDVSDGISFVKGILPNKAQVIAPTQPIEGEKISVEIPSYHKNIANVDWATFVVGTTPDVEF